MSVYAKDTGQKFISSRPIKMARKRGTALDARMQRIRGCHIVIDYDTNTFDVVGVANVNECSANDNYEHMKEV